MAKQITRNSSLRQPISRRAMLVGTASVLGTAAMPFGKAHAWQQERPTVPDDPTKVQGRGASELGTRSAFERPRRVYSSERPTSGLGRYQAILW